MAVSLFEAAIFLLNNKVSFFKIELEIYILSGILYVSSGKPEPDNRGYILKFKKHAL